MGKSQVMKRRMAFLRRRMIKEIGIVFVLACLHVSSGPLLAQVPKAPALSPPTEVAPARFEAMVYEVQIPEARIAELEASALEAKAGHSAGVSESAPGIW